MAVLTLGNTNYIEFDEVFEDTVSLELYLDYYCAYGYIDITKEQAIQIINHLKEQFSI